MLRLRLVPPALCCGSRRVISSVKPRQLNAKVRDQSDFYEGIDVSFPRALRALSILFANLAQPISPHGGYLQSEGIVLKRPAHLAHIAAADTLCFENYLLTTVYF